MNESTNNLAAGGGTLGPGGRDGGGPRISAEPSTEGNAMENQLTDEPTSDIEENDTTTESSAS